MKQQLSNRLRAVWVAFSDLYFAFFFIWFIMSMLTHGKYAWVNLMNMFAFQAFLLLMPCALAGIILKLVRLRAASGIAALLFLFMFAGFFFPKSQTAYAASDTLTVMTYNMLAFSPEPAAIVDVIRAADADIVVMQEINFGVAELLQNDMQDVYPYQVHLPSQIPTGTSVVSKYPFTPMKEKLGSKWVGEPILLEVDWRGEKIAVVNFHMAPTPLQTVVSPGIFNKISDKRREESQAMVDLLRRYPGPMIFAGDMNDVFLNDAYRMLTAAGLQDAWMEAGFGLGHTFPGNKSPGTSRPHVGGLYVPEWLVRIDYIFVTPEWEVLSARIVPDDGYSDHRPVTATLRLRNEN